MVERDGQEAWAVSRDPSPSSRRAGAALLGGLLAAVCAAAALVWAEPGTRDDAFVVLAQARSVAAGGGFALGREGAAVAASTSLLDVLQKAALLAAGPSDPVRACGWLGMFWLLAAASFGGALGTLLATRRAARGRLLVALCVAVALGGAAPLAESAAYGLEGPPVAAIWLLLLALVAAARGARGVVSNARVAWAAVPLAWTLTVARPEGLVLGPVAWLLVEWGGGAPRALGGLRARALTLVAGLALYHAAYAAAFGAPFPNSYYAKRADALLLEWRDGLAYVLAFAVTPAGGLLALATVAALRPAARSDVARRLALAALAALGVVVASGGDAYVGSRLLLPMHLALLLALCAGLGGAARAGAPIAWAPVAWLLVAASGLPAIWPALRAPGVTVRALASGPAGEAELFGGDRVLLERIAAAFAAAPPTQPVAQVVAHRHAQRFLWYRPAGLELLDLTGLTDPEIARRPTDGPVRFGRDALDLALERRAAVLFLDHQPTRPASWAGRDLARLLSTPERAREFLGSPVPRGELARELAERYRAMSFSGPYGPGRHVNLLILEQLAPLFEAQGFR